MNREEFGQIVLTTLEECKSVLDTKRRDYAPDDDRLANFKSVGLMMALEPQTVCLTYLMKHLDAIASHCDSLDLSVEYFDSRIVDCINYLLLLKAILVEKSDE